MQRFVRHRGIVAVIFRANIDTDQIIPKQFLKSVKRTGYGENLFYDWRYDREGKPRPDFLLNR
ncbi:MAG TPA: 3-isopropylmalate dehydratase small subunit, partial [Lentisphaerae bacterium]|nr:3-isopropylmalate dehydratase small subunit [Lentisphaerota bacterium]